MEVLEQHWGHLLANGYGDAGNFEASDSQASTTPGEENNDDVNSMPPPPVPPKRDTLPIGHLWPSDPADRAAAIKARMEALRILEYNT